MNSLSQPIKEMRERLKSGAQDLYRKISPADEHAFWEREALPSELENAVRSTSPSDEEKPETSE